MPADPNEPFDSDPQQIGWIWTCNEEGTSQGCDHTVQIIPANPTGIELSPLYLHFEAERGGAVPAKQNAQLWTGGGLAMPWTAVPDAWWFDTQPATGSQASQIEVQPNSTLLDEGIHESDLLFSTASTAANVMVTYAIHKSPGEIEETSPVEFSVEVWPQPVSVGGLLFIKQIMIYQKEVESVYVIY